MAANTNNTPYEKDPGKLAHIKDEALRKRVLYLCQRTTELAMRSNAAFGLGAISGARQLKLQYHLAMAELMSIRPAVDAASAARQKTEVERHQALAGGRALAAA